MSEVKCRCIVCGHEGRQAADEPRPPRTGDDFAFEVLGPAITKEAAQGRPKWGFLINPASVDFRVSDYGTEVQVAAGRAWVFADPDCPMDAALPVDPLWLRRRMCGLRIPKGI